MNKILNLFQGDFVLDFLNKKILPLYPDFKKLEKVKIIPHKNNVWEHTYHVVIEFETTFLNKDNKKIKLPILGNETETKEISLDQIQPILHARIEEIFVLIRDKLYESSAIDHIDGGIILTGGMTQTQGIKELASEVFVNIPVKIANPINIQNGYVDFQTPSMATIAGILVYALDTQSSFELDSNNNLRMKSEVIKSSITQQTDDKENKVEDDIRQKEETLANIANIDEKNQEKPKKLGGIWEKISRWL